MTVQLNRMTEAPLPHPRLGGMTCDLVLACDSPHLADRQSGLRVGLAGAPEVLHAGLRALLSQCAGRAGLVDAEDVLPSAVDVLLVDVQSASRVPRLIRQKVEAGFDPVVAYVVESDPVQRRRMLEAGARGSVSMRLGASDLVHHLETLVQPSGAVRPPLATPYAADGLTRRETEVLSLISRGLSNQEVADQLFMSINTVKTYIRTAYWKIGVTRRAHAIIWAIEHGY